ncbi:ATP-binding protein [Pelosinus sp. sgz500959]|uniref:ATP-binding protein n=1 Tax=Pelosinus sp. sgz500959 TaxID=3242472 RepID=UPI0036708A88
MFTLSKLTQKNKQHWLSNYSCLIILLGVLLIGGLWLHAYNEIKYDYDRTLAETSQETMNLTKAFEEHVRRVVTEADKDMINLQKAYERDGISSPLFSTYAENLMEDPSRNLVAIYNEQGVIVVSFIQNVLGANRSDREYFQIHRVTDSQDLVIGRPVIGLSSGQNIIPMTRRINKPDGSFGGIVFLGLKANYFLEFYKKIDLGQNQLISLIGKDGFNRARRVGDNLETGQDNRGSKFWENVQNGHLEASFLSTNILDKVTRVTSYRIIPEYPLIVAVGKSTQVAMAAYEERKKNYIFGVSLVCLFILFFCSLLISKHEKTRRLAAAVQHEKDQLSALINSMSDEVWFADINKTFIFANQAAHQGFHLDSAEMTIEQRLSNLEVRCPDGSPRLVEDAPPLRALKGEVILNEQQLVLIPTTGEWRSREITANPVRDGEGNIIGSVSIVRDVTERKAMEEELKAQFEKLREMQEALSLEKLLTDALFNSVPGILYLYDDQGKLVRWNKRHEEMTGYCANQLLGMDFLAWYKGDEETTEYINKMVQKALKEGFAEAEADLRRKDGTKMVAYLTAVPLEVDGKIYFAGIGIDIAGRKKAEQEMKLALERAESANLAKSQFLANMSHEIRTPMNGIIGMTDLTLMTDLKEDQREYLTIVKSSTISLLRVLNDILDYSKVEAGKIELEKKSFDLQKTMNEVIDLFDIGARKKGLNLALKIEREVPNHIIGDSVRLRQILSNLVGNGIKFTYQGEVLINVEVEEQNDKQVKIKFIVTDTGIGIPEDKLDKLFKRFSQVDGSTTKKFGGTGLGLAISKKIIEIMDGEIGVESKENLGSSFFFTAVFELPEEKVKDLIEDITVQGSIRCNNEKTKKILLAEDDVISRDIVTIMLKQRGFEVIAVENGIEAINAFENSKFDIILMDINMPYVDGYSATVSIRSKEKYMNDHTPIIAMTAYALKGDREKCLEVGMDDYITKPININQAMDIIEKYANAVIIHDNF